MTVSNDTTWALNGDQIISRAYAKLGIPGEGNTLSTQQISDGLENLNHVVTMANADGMDLWKRNTTLVTPNATLNQFNVSGAVKVAQVFLKDNTSGVQYDLIEKSYYDFNRLPQGTTGVPVHYWFQPPGEGQVGTINIWPLQSDVGTIAQKTIGIVWQGEMDDFVTGLENIDFPVWWTTAIVYKLAVLLAPESGVPLPDRQILKQESDEFWKLATGYGDEDGSLYIQADRTSW